MEDKYPVGSVFRQMVDGKEIEGVVVHSRNRYQYEICIIWNNNEDFYRSCLYYPESFIDKQIEEKNWTQVR